MLLAVTSACMVCCTLHTKLSPAAESCTSCGVALLEINCKQVIRKKITCIHTNQCLSNTSASDWTTIKINKRAQINVTVFQSCIDDFSVKSVANHRILQILIKSAKCIRIHSNLLNCKITNFKYCNQSVMPHTRSLQACKVSITFITNHYYSTHERSVDNKDRCEWVNVSSGTGSPR